MVEISSDPLDEQVRDYRSERRADTNRELLYLIIGIRRLVHVVHFFERENSKLVFVLFDFLESMNGCHRKRNRNRRFPNLPFHVIRNSPPLAISEIVQAIKTRIHWHEARCGRLLQTLLSQLTDLTLWFSPTILKYPSTIQIRKRCKVSTASSVLIGLGHSS